MTMYNDAMYCGDQSSKMTQFTNGAYTIVDVSTVDNNGPIRIDSLSVSNDDTVAGVLTLSIHNGTTAYPVAQIVVAANSLLNTGANSPVDVLRSRNLTPFVVYDSAGNPYLELAAGNKLQAAMVAAPSSGKTFNVRCHWGKYAFA